MPVSDTDRRDIVEVLRDERYIGASYIRESAAREIEQLRAFVDWAIGEAKDGRDLDFNSVQAVAIKYGVAKEK